MKPTLGSFGKAMKVETDIKRIEMLAAQKEDDNWKFRCFLKRRCDLPSEEIDALFQRFSEDVTREIDCTECANCCRKVSPLLNSKDVETLAALLGLSRGVFCEKYLVESEEDDGFHFKILPCPFLKGNFCTVYSSRPHDCRSYPHLHKKDRVFSMNAILSNCSVCPIVYNVYELLKEELSDTGQMDGFVDFDYE